MTPIDWTQPAEAIGEQIIAQNEEPVFVYYKDSVHSALYTVERMLEVCPVFGSSVTSLNLAHQKLTEVKEYLKSKL